jgi:aminoglycoside phosphotransferase (APT) family kinase protein
MTLARNGRPPAPHLRKIGALIDRGRDAAVYEAGPGLVWRCYNDPSRDATPEADLIAFLNAEDFPCPKVFDVVGSAMLLERVAGPSLAQSFAQRPPLQYGEVIDVIVDLHDLLHAVTAPTWLRPVIDGEKHIVHLDIHLHNVVLGSGGPVLIDWSYAGLGPAAADLAQTWLLLASAPDPIGDHLTLGRRNVLVEAFLSRVDRRAAQTLLPKVCDDRLELSFLEPEERKMVTLLRDGSPQAPGMRSRRARAAGRGDGRRPSVVEEPS